MNKILITLNLLFLVTLTKAQTKNDDRVTYVSEKKDTLILPNNSLGKTIALVWDKSKDKKPVILYADEAVIEEKNKRQTPTLTQKSWFKH